ncbi:MAG TPA: ABC transporter ATP-binding protein [Gemmatimonadales bacterium]|nr:ABC transporter ATP-binding protein [Gemmatimonadales bacterium]
MKDLRALWPALRPYRNAYLLGLLAVVGANAFRTLNPQFIRQGIDAIGTGASATQLRTAILLLVVTALCSGLCRYAMRQVLNSVSRRVETDLRDTLFAHLERQSAGFYDRHPTGDLIARATNDLQNVRMVAGPALMYLVDTIVLTLMVVPAMATISWRLTAWVFVPLICLPAVMIWFGRRIHERTQAIQAHFGVLTDHVVENLSGVRIVRAYRQERAEAAEFERLSAEYLRRNLALVNISGMFHPILGFIAGSGAAIILLVGGRQVMAGTLTVGAFIAFGAYLAQFIWPMIAVGWAVNLVQRGAASMRRINELLDEAPAITDPAAPESLPPATGPRALAVEGLWFQYPNARERGWVLQDVSFRLAPGESLAIVGATGSGKSTLLELLTRAHDPDRGRVLVDGVDIRRLTLADLRRAVSHVPQETFLFSATVRENVLFGMPDDGRLERSAEAAQLTEALPALPDGYDTMLGERGINLSGGQKQRTAIARALAKDAPIFLLDDALSAVDAHTEARILQNLRSALAGKTTVIVSHRLAAVKDATRILVLDGGRVAEEGTHAELMRREGRYWELVRRQQLEEALEGS